MAVDGENMLLFELGDVDKLERIITDKALGMKLSEESTKLSTGIISLEKVVEEVGEIYERVL